jgi:hypothetical protein
LSEAAVFGEGGGGEDADYGYGNEEFKEGKSGLGTIAGHGGVTLLIWFAITGRSARRRGEMLFKADCYSICAKTNLLIVS